MVSLNLCKEYVYIQDTSLTKLLLTLLIKSWIFWSMERLTGVKKNLWSGSPCLL